MYIPSLMSLLSILGDTDSFIMCMSHNYINIFFVISLHVHNMISNKEKISVSEKSYLFTSKEMLGIGGLTRG